jgi:RHS repeat-associated protein
MKSNGTIYWYGANSASLMESDLNGNVQRWYYFFDGQRVGRQLPTNEVGFYMTDHLGSVRYLGGSATGYSIDYYPYGGVILNSDTGDDRYQFTGKERDSESGLDNFGARFDSSSIGRFMSPDWDSKPQAIPYADLANPQTFNLYSYVLNNPLSKTDPNGHDWFYADKKWQWQKGHTFHDANGNATKDKGYAGLLVAQATGTNKQGATTYSLTLYDQNKVVATGTGFSGNNNNPDFGAVKDGNYQILGRFDAPPTAPNPSSRDNNPPPVFGYQAIDPSLNRYAKAVYDAYGPMLARLSPLDPGNSDVGVYFHGQFGDSFHSEGWTHGCLSYGRDTTMIDYMATHFGNAWTGVSVNTPVVKPQ